MHASNTPSRVALQVCAARRAHSLAIRFARKGDQFNAHQAHSIAIRAMQQARDIQQRGYL
jgi:hypothetical protein